VQHKFPNLLDSAIENTYSMGYYGALGTNTSTPYITGTLLTSGTIDL
jgi:hypothetical protein